MADMPRQSVRIEDFQGMVTNTDPADLKPGQSRLQINLSGLKRGELALRRGLRPLEFDSEDS